MFIENVRWQLEDHLRVHAVLLVTASLCLMSHPVSADPTESHINCVTQADAISQTLATLDADGPHHIFVQGDCFDSVHIFNRIGVTIEAAGGGASISPPNFMNPFAVAIDSARGITFINIHFTNINGVSNANGVFVDNNSEVQIANSTIDGSVSDGITVSGQSLLRLDDTTIQNNGANGLTVQIGSTAQLGGGVAMNIINNGSNGIELTQGTLHVSGSLTVDSNGGNGLLMSVGSRATIDTDTGPNTFSNNGASGISLAAGTLRARGPLTVDLNAGHGLELASDSSAIIEAGPVSISNNSANGIRLSAGTLRSTASLTADFNRQHGLNMTMGSRASIEGGSNTFSNNFIHGVAVRIGSTIEFAGDNTIANNAFHGLVVIEGGTARVSNGVTVIMGNSRFGVLAILDSGVRFIGPHQIRSNGNLNFGGGVFVSNNSSFVAQNGTDISNNIGVGVITEIDASTSFRDATITNNSKEGLLLRRIAVAEFFGSLTTISGNGIADLACDNTSLVFGDLTGIVVNTCDSFLELIASISDQIQAIVASAPGSSLADKVEDVRDKVQVAVVELNRTPPDNQAAVGNIEGAVGDVQAAVDDGVLDSALGDLLMDQLAGVAKQIASNAIEQAMAGGGDSDKIADAVLARADGDALLASPTYKDAVNKYKDAVSIAEGA